MYSDERLKKVTARIPEALYEEFARLLPIHGQKQRFFQEIIEYVVRSQNSEEEVILFIDKVKRGI